MSIISLISLSLAIIVFATLLTYVFSMVSDKSITPIGPIVCALIVPCLIFGFVNITLTQMTFSEPVIVSNIEKETLIGELEMLDRNNTYLQINEKDGIRKYTLLVKKREGVKLIDFDVDNTTIVEFETKDVARIVRPQRVITKSFEENKYSKMFKMKTPEDQIEETDLYNESYKIYIPKGSKNIM